MGAVDVLESLSVVCIGGSASVLGDIGRPGVELAGWQRNPDPAWTDWLAAMQAGLMDVTAYQNATGQGEQAVCAAIAAAQGQAVPPDTCIPFQPVPRVTQPDILNSASRPGSPT